MKILVLGSTGFVGRNLVDMLSPQVDVLKTSRFPPDSSYIYFDLLDTNSWKHVCDLNPDVVINAIAYGVIKNELDMETMYKINYLTMVDFYYFMLNTRCNPFWIQLGTAFEYDLSVTGGITEQSACLPQTHYGISKLMFSNFLTEKAMAGKASVFRPFGMFGKYEDESKFFPMLIRAQKSKTAVKLSAGTQQRDYFFVEDLGIFIQKLVKNEELKKLPKVLNLGSGEAKSFRAYAEVLSKTILEFDESCWQWGEVSFRANESALFYNGSTMAKQLGFTPSDLKDSFMKTANFYGVG